MDAADSPSLQKVEFKSLPLEGRLDSVTYIQGIVYGKKNLK
jgi:hypothetical protein